MEQMEFGTLNFYYHNRESGKPEEHAEFRNHSSESETAVKFEGSCNKVMSEISDEGWRVVDVERRVPTNSNTPYMTVWLQRKA